MAIVSVICRVNYDSERNLHWVRFLPNNSDTSPLTVIKGDQVQFTVQQGGEASGYTFVIYGFDAGYWTDNSASPTLAPGATLTRTTNVNASVGSGYLEEIAVQASGSPTVWGSLWIRIVDDQDGIPDPFDVGSNVTGVAPSSRIAGVPFVLTGLTTTTTATCSAGSDFVVNGGLLTTSATVKNGDRLQLYVTSASAWDTAVTGTLTIGGVSDSMVVTTVAQPSQNQLIPFPKSVLPISLNDVINFFGGNSFEYPPKKNLRAYFKDGEYVPNINANLGIPSSGNLALSSFLGSATALMFSQYPKSQNISGSTLSGSKTLALTWSVGIAGATGFDVGYGPGMKGAVEYRYTLQENSGNLLSTGVIFSSMTGSPTAWNSANSSVSLSQTHSNAEHRYRGTLIIEIRSKFYPGVVVSATVHYTLNFYGP